TAETIARLWLHLQVIRDPDRVGSNGLGELRAMQHVSPGGIAPVATFSPWREEYSDLHGIRWPLYQAGKSATESSVTCADAMSDAVTGLPLRTSMPVMPRRWAGAMSLRASSPIIARLVTGSAISRIASRKKGGEGLPIVVMRTAAAFAIASMKGPLSRVIP